MILMDNASYNRGEDTAKQIKKLRLPVMFTAPYSYEASPIERYFGYFKQGRILKPFESSGKR
jgi:transposase